ncbi:hypothetical protein CTEN210_02118 [Chaetoceros tenuissimus]|uniref:Cilia- and flagella-associated protein 57 n=1 Tax=Chaetoceros tenuissimus TaxID=426638 RepID=A0AAD3CIX2_9STRA|nr:hypothetical protein CTEN210_02118 [Chaetoceros tenuissimus]
MNSFSIFELELEKKITDSTTPVFDIKVCKTPILCTLNEDGVSIWNVQTGEKYFSKHLSSRPKWISLHPSGFQLCIGFEECVKCFHVLNNDLDSYWNFKGSSPFGCFNEGGNELGLIEKNAVHIFDFVSGEKVQSLSVGKKIEKFLWMNCDTNMLVQDESKNTLSLWNLSTNSILKEYTQFKNESVGLDFASITSEQVWLSHETGVSMIPVPSMSKGQEIITFQNQTVLRMLSSHEHNSFCVFLLDDSTIQVIDTVSKAKVDLKLANDEQPTTFAITSDDKHIVVGYGYGCLEVYNVKDNRCLGTMLTEVEASADDSKKHPLGLLVTSDYYEEKQNALHSLNSTLREITREFESQRHEMEHTLQEEKRLLCEKSQKQEDDVANTLKAVEDKMNGMMRKYHTEFNHTKEVFDVKFSRQEKEHFRKVENLEHHFHEERRIQSIELQELEGNINKIEKQNNNAIVELKEEVHAEISTLNMVNKKFESENKSKKKKIKEIRNQLEDEVDEQISQTKEDFQQRLQDEQSKTLKIWSTSGVLRKKNNALNLFLGEQKETVKLMLEREETLSRTVEDMEAVILALEKELTKSKQMKSIVQQKLDYLEVQKKELQSFQAELFHSKTTLERDLNDTTAIDNIHEKIRSGEDLLKELGVDNNDVGTYILATTNSLQQLNSELKQQELKKRQLSRTLNGLKEKTYGILQSIQDPKLPNEVKSLCSSLEQTPTREKVTDEDGSNNSSVTDSLKQEIVRKQRELNELRTKSDKECGSLREDNQKLLQEIRVRKEENEKVRDQLKAFRSEKLAPLI